jgi:predicted nucleic acid-binding protein
LVCSNVVRLEVIPQAAFHKQARELDFYSACFSFVTTWVEVDTTTIRRAEDLATKYGLHAIDALHVSAAIGAGATEFITTERPTKPLYRVTEIRVISLEEIA